MSNVVAVFRSRSDTLKFSNELNKLRIATQIINTPREAGKTCGISVKMSANAILPAKRVLQNGIYPSFAGFYAETGNTYKLV